MPFSDYEIDYIAEHCYKLAPQTNPIQSIVIFMENDMCLVKGRATVSRKGEKDKEYEVFSLRSYQATSEEIDDCIGPVLTQFPLFSLEEAVFAVLAIVTNKLPPHLANDLIVETDQNPTRH